MARNKKVEILSNDKEVLHPMTDGDCVIFEDGQSLAQKLSEDDSVKYTPEIVNSSPMFKVGEGNTVDYSDNVLDGAYERATLQGQTYVNYIQESSADEVILPTPFTEYERTQHNTLTSDEEGTLGINLVGQSYINALQHDSEEEFVVLGESLEFQEKKVEYTNEGQIKSAMLKGQTLVNLVPPFEGVKTSLYNWDGTDMLTEFNDTSYKVTAQNANTNIAIKLYTKGEWQINQPLKTNTTYFAIVDLDVQFSKNMFIGCGENSYSGIYGKTELTTGRQKAKFKFTTPSKINSSLCIGTGLYYNVGEYATFYSCVIVEYVDGMENWDIPYFEGMQSVTVSTRLENLCHKYNGGLAKNGKTFTTNSLSDRCIKLVDYKEGAEATYGMKPNTKYLVQFKISNLVLDGLSSLTMAFSVGESGTANCLFKNGTKTGLITANGVYRVVLTTTDLVSTSGVEIKGIGTEWESSRSILRSLKISEVMYVEYQNGMENWNLPYFEDYQVMKPVQVESVNKNLFNGELELGGYAGTTGGKYDGTDRVRSTTKTFLKAGTYYLSSSNATKIAFNLYNMDNTFRQEHAANSDRVKLILEKEAYSHITVVTPDLLNAQIQLEESDTATEYVPHQSKTTYSWDEVILRKVGDVEDTLDLTTGEWVQRIGEIVLDGDENCYQANIDKTPQWFYTDNVQDSIGVIFKFASNNITNCFGFFETDSHLYSISDKFPVSTRLDSVLGATTNVVVCGGITDTNADSSSCYIGFKIKTSDYTNMATFRVWLKSNPVKIQYVLKTPIVHKVNLSRPNLQVYNDITHVHTKCLDGTLIPNIYLPSDISYPAILEPGKKYNVCVNHTEVSADNPLKVNVGGTEITMTDSRMTLTTPTTLANSNVSFTGKGNKIKESMLIKNSSLLTRDLPHFNGIGSVQLGKTIENLCDSTDSMYGSCVATKTVYNDHASVTVTKTGSLVICSSLIRPLENGKKYFVYAPNTFPTVNACHVGFYNYYNDTHNFGHQVKSVQTGKCIIEIDQKDKLYTMITLGYHGKLAIGTYTINKPIICEYEPGMENWDWESIGYFTGTKNIGNEFMKISNSDATKHNGLYITKDQPIELTWEQGRINPSGIGDSYTNAINNAVSYGIRTKGLLNLKPNTTYRISLGDKANYKYHIAVFDNWDNALPSAASLGISRDWISSIDTIFTTTKDAHKIGINVQKQNASSITSPESVHAQVRLEEVTDVILRSCSSKYDELDLTRGIYTQNVGMVYLDGINSLSQQITVVDDTYQPTDKTLKSFDIRCVGALLSSKCSCNKFPSRDGGGASANISFESVCIHSENVSCRLTISTEKASTLEEFKLWLQDNPLEILYQLKTPIAYKVHIGNKNEANIEVTKPNDVFTLPTLYAERTHIDLTNNGIIPKVQSRNYIAYPVSPMVGRTYTLQHNLTGGVSNLTVDLLGRTQSVSYQNHKSLVYSPETMDAILHHELRISGKGKISRVMYIDGAYMDRDIPYFEDMKNAVNPIVKNYMDTQENICYVGCGDETIYLRSLPHGVQDEIDLETGKYIQRVGEITFNGTENWQPGYSSWDNKRTYWNHDFVDLKTMKGDNGSGQAYYDAVRCPQLHRSYMGKLASASIDGICSYYYSGYQRIFISKQDCATVNELKLWLQENPITVQYELPEPIVKDIVIHNYPHLYEGGHVIIENGDPNTPIPAQLTYRAVTNRSGQIQQHTEQVEKQEREINELETLILANIHLSQTR